MIVEDPITTSIEHRDGVTVLAVGGEIDMETAPVLQRAIAAVLAGRPAALVIDLFDVDFLASAGIQLLVATREKVGESARFAVSAQSVVPSRLIRLLHLDKFLALHETLEDAVASVKTRKPGSEPTSKP